MLVAVAVPDVEVLPLVWEEIVKLQGTQRVESRALVHQLLGC